MGKYKAYTAIQVPFDDIFYFAEKEYGIGWNPCNDLFFNHVFDYGQVSSVEYNGRDYSEGAVSLEELDGMSTTQKADAILSHFLFVNGLTSGNIEVDSR